MIFNSLSAHATTAVDSPPFIVSKIDIPTRKTSFAGFYATCNMQSNKPEQHVSPETSSQYLMEQLPFTKVQSAGISLSERKRARLSIRTGRDNIAELGK